MPRPHRQLEIPLQPGPLLPGADYITHEGKLVCGRCKSKRGCKLCRQLRDEWTGNRRLMAPKAALYLLARTPCDAFAKRCIADCERFGFAGVAHQIRDIVEDNKRILAAMEPYWHQRYRMRWDRWDTMGDFTPFAMMFEFGSGHWKFAGNIHFHELAWRQIYSPDGELWRLSTLTGIRIVRGPHAHESWTEDDLVAWHWEQQGFEGKVDWRPKEILPEDYYAL